LRATSRRPRRKTAARDRCRSHRTVDDDRRLDELRQNFGAIYGTRDVIQDMKREIEELRRKQAAP
jgi:hypothetical protein